MGIEALSNILEANRLEVIAERREAFIRFGQAHPSQRHLIHSEWILPLNERLLSINKRLGK